MRWLLLFMSMGLMSIVIHAQDLDLIDERLADDDFNGAMNLIDAELQKGPSSESAFRLQCKKAEVLVRNGKYDDAEKVLASLHPSSVDQVALAESNMGFLHLNRGRNDLALESLRKAMDNWERGEMLSSLDAAQTQSYLGNLYMTTGKYVQGEEQLSIALLTRQKLLPAQHELIAASLNDLGLLYSFVDTDKALNYYEKALAIYQQLHGTKHSKIAIANTNIGYLYSKMELYGDAINNFESALAIWTEIYPQPHPAKGFVLFSMGQTYEKMKDMKTARSFYEKAADVYRNSYSGKHPDIARVYNALGNLEQAESKFESSLLFYQKAIIANHSAFDSDDVNMNPNVTAYYDGHVLLHSLMSKAQVLELSYFRKTLRFKDLLLAIRTLQCSDTLIDHLRQQIRNESDKINLGDVANEVYADGVRICAEAAGAAWSKASLYEQAFYFAERSKAAVLLAAISDANAKSFAGIPASTLEEERQLKSAIALVSQKLAQRPDASEEKYLRMTFYELNRNYETFTLKLEKDYPSYFNLKYNSTIPSIKAIQGRLAPNSVIVSYFTDTKNSRLYIFKITKGSLRLEDKVLPAEFDRYLTGLKNSLFFSDLNTYKAAATNLSALLIPKLPSSIGDVVIIPDSHLGTIPFETLLTAKPGDDDTYATLPYLIRSYSVRYEFSSGLILQKKGQNKNSSPSILLCAPVTFPRSANFSDLPATEAEVVDISNLFLAHKLPTELLLREKADEQTIKDEDLKRFSLVHFATHGIVDEMNPELSSICLNAGKDSEDGTLYAGEIYNLELDADLVTLSACQTGLGKISKGEGVIGLSRALVYAGARNCMVSFWKVADESTALFMKDYYTILLNNSPANYSVTLRTAKLNLIRQEKYAAPYYWAPFILIGF